MSHRPGGGWSQRPVRPSGVRISAPAVRGFAAAAGLGALALAAPQARALQPTDRVKISEVCYDPAEIPATAYEFVELYNAGNTVAYLDGAVVSDQGNNGTNETTFQFPGTPLTGTTLPIAPGQFVLIAVSATGSPYAGIDWEFFAGGTDTDLAPVPNLVKTSGLGSDLGLANTGDGLTLSTGVSNGNVIPCAEVVDGVSWQDGGGVNEVNPVSRTVCSDPAPHQGLANGQRSIQRRTNGNDTERTNDDFGIAVRTPRAPAPCLLDPTCVRDLAYSPCVPLANQPVSVSVHIGGGTWSSIRIFHKLDTAALYDSATAVPGPDTTWVAVLPGRPNLSRVEYWLRAVDTDGNSLVLPAPGPGTAAQYRVGVVSIASIQGTVAADSCGSSTFAGQAVNVRGVVTHHPAEFDFQYFYVQRGTGTNSGIRVFVPVLHFTPALRDSVSISGIVQESNCETEIVLFPKCGQVLAVKRRVEPRVLPAVSHVALEQNEGMLVTIAGPIQVASDFDTTGSSFEFRVGNGGDAAWVGGDTFWPDNNGYSYRPVPGHGLDALTGIVMRRTPNTFDGVTRLRLEPRRDNDVDLDYTDTGDPGGGIDVVGAFRLRPNVPNPFNPTTAVEYDLRAAGETRVEIFDARGARVRTLVSGLQPPGPHRVLWDGRDDAGRGVASGLYVVRLRSGADSASHKMLLLR